MIARLGLLLALAAGVAEAKPGTPGPPYFTGVYERVGRDASAALLDDQVMIAPAGSGVEIRACLGTPLRMGFGPAFEINNLMTGARDGVAVDCLFHNNGYNRPILTCRAKDGTAFTLWPTEAQELLCG